MLKFILCSYKKKNLLYAKGSITQKTSNISLPFSIKSPAQILDYSVHEIQMLPQKKKGSHVTIVLPITYIFLRITNIKIHV